MGAALYTVQASVSRAVSEKRLFSRVFRVELDARHIHLKILWLHDARWGARGEQIGSGNEGTENAGDGGKEAEDILDASETVVHDGQPGFAHQILRAMDVVGVA